MNGLDTSRIIHMRDGWDIRTRYVEFGDSEQRALCVGHRPPVRLGNIGYERHIRAVCIKLEPIVHVLS